jgi:3-isopropylmalate/(R)-2-methylmalate dehydratase small subunit
LKPFTKITSIVTPFDKANVDTDQIIPKQFLKLITKSGFGKFLFYDWRFDHNGQKKNDFVLNDSTYHDSQILITNENFGCGSSREHAVWALKDFGFNVIISPSFADIFYSNCFKNGVLPIILDIGKIKKLLQFKDKIELDLDSQKITFGDESITFEIDSHRKIRLLEGLDDIDLTLKEDEKIEYFEKNSSRISISISSSSEFD